MFNIWDGTECCVFKLIQFIFYQKIHVNSFMQFIHLLMQLFRFEPMICIICSQNINTNCIVFVCTVRWRKATDAAQMRYMASFYMYLMLLAIDFLNKMLPFSLEWNTKNVRSENYTFIMYIYTMNEFKV